MFEGNYIMKIEFDNALNEAGWALIRELNKYGGVTGHVFNNIKPSLKVAIELYMDEKAKVKPIPQTKEVEWVNGEPLEYKGEDDEWEHNGRYVCFDGYGEHHVFTARDGMMYHASDEQIRKPETQAERVERERLEAAYDLYVDFPGSGCICTFEEFVIKLHLVSKWLRMVDKTNYRKNSD